MSKLEIKDLITVGIFGVLYFVIFYAVGMTQLIPKMYAISPLLISFVGGIPFVLFITRVDKFGMVSLMGIIFKRLTWILSSLLFSFWIKFTFFWDWKFKSSMPRKL